MNSQILQPITGLSTTKSKISLTQYNRMVNVANGLQNESTGGQGIVAQMQAGSFRYRVHRRGAAETTDILRHAWKFIFDKSVSETGGTITPGYVWINSVLTTPATLPDPPWTLVNVVLTTYYWIEVNFLTKTAAWKSSTDAFGTGTKDVYVYEILQINCTSGKITDWVQRRCSDLVLSSSTGTHEPEVYATLPTPGTMDAEDEATATFGGLYGLFFTLLTRAVWSSTDNKIYGYTRAFWFSEDGHGYAVSKETRFVLYSPTPPTWEALVGTPTHVLGKNANGDVGWVELGPFSCT